MALKQQLVARLTGVNAALLVLRETIGSQVQGEKEAVEEQFEEAGELNSSLSTGVAGGNAPTRPSSIADCMRRNAAHPKGREPLTLHSEVVSYSAVKSPTSRT